MVSETYYNAMGSRSFYKGTSFRCTKWCLETHYFNNEDFIDFVSYNGALLRCTRSHVSSSENEPFLIIENGNVIGIENTPVWEFVMGGASTSEDTELNVTFKVENEHLFVSYDNQSWKDLGNVKGDKGDPGSQGEPGKGVPEGGLVNQVLVKQSNEDYDTIWKTIQTSGGGEIQTFSARVLSTSSTTGSPEANVSLSDTNEFQFSFKLQKGIDGTNGKDGSPGKDGADGKPGQNGDGVKYIYIRTNKVTPPTTPVGNGENEELPSDIEWGSWTSQPTGVDSTYRWEWVSTSTYINNVWSTYGKPSLFAYYALDGVIPNYKTYVYIQSDSKPEKPTFNTPQPPMESSWKDYPLSSGQWWQCIGTVDGQSNTVIKWGEVLPVNGKDGTAQDGKFTEFRFAVNNSNITPPSLSEEVRTPEGWTLEPPVKDNSQYLWMTTAVINPNDTLFRNWSVPVCISGESGEDGTQGAAGNWTSYVFKSSEEAPDTPTGIDPVPEGWGDAPTGTVGIWWMSKALISGVTQKVIGNWSVPQRITGENGQDGQNGTDGIYTDYKFAKSSSKDEPPAINKQNENPGNNWSDQWPVVSSGEFLWMTFIKRNSKDNTIISGEQWATPVCITGEQGPEGPIGATGVSGTPGVGIVMRFCNGTDDTPSKSKPSNILDTTSQGWTITPPATSTEYPRIWFIQGRIKYLNNEDTTGLLDGSWSDPALFNGPAGANGEVGRKGQLIYPAGIYTENTTYITTEDSAPYVYVYHADSSKSGYYLLSAVTSWTGIDHNNWTPAESIENEEHYWTKFNHFETIFADVSIFPNSLVGTAVFNGDYMFSQTGKNTSGVNTNYHNFNPSNLTEWTPAYYVNLKTGEASLNFGQCTFKYINDYSIETIMTLKGNLNTIPNLQYAILEDNFIKSPNVNIVFPEINQSESYSNNFEWALSNNYIPEKGNYITGVITNGCNAQRMISSKDCIRISPAIDINEQENGRQLTFHLPGDYDNSYRNYLIDYIYLTPGRSLDYTFEPIWYVADEYTQYISTDFHVEGSTGSESYTGIYGNLYISNPSDFVLLKPTSTKRSVSYNGVTVTYPKVAIVSRELYTAQ